MGLGGKYHQVSPGVSRFGLFTKTNALCHAEGQKQTWKWTWLSWIYPASKIWEKNPKTTRKKAPKIPSFGATQLQDNVRWLRGGCCIHDTKVSREISQKGKSMENWGPTFPKLTEMPGKSVPHSGWCWPCREGISAAGGAQSVRNGWAWLEPAQIFLNFPAVPSAGRGKPAGISAGGWVLGLGDLFWARNLGLNGFPHCF